MAWTFALRPGAPAMAFGNGSNNIEPQAGALDPSGQGSGDAIKTLEDLFQLHLRDAWALVAHSQRYELIVHRLGLYQHLHGASGIFDGVVDQIGYSGAHFVQIAQDRNRRPGVILERLGSQPVQRADSREAFINDAIQIDLAEVQPAAAGGTDAAGAEHLLDGGQQAIAILHHGAVKLLAFGFFDGPGLEGFEVEADRCDRGL